MLNIEREQDFSPDSLKESEQYLFKKFAENARVLDAKKGYIDLPWVNQLIDTESLSHAGNLLAAQFSAEGIDVVAGIPTMGIYLATATAQRLRCDLVPSRKGREIPGSWRNRFSAEGVPSFTTGEPAVLTFNGFSPGNSAARSILLIDDFIANGDTLLAVINQMRENEGGTPLNIYVGAYAAKLFQPGVSRLQEAGIHPRYIYGIQSLSENGEIQLAPPNYF